MDAIWVGGGGGSGGTVIPSLGIGLCMLEVPAAVPSGKKQFITRCI
jgi:hypothetical protein